MKLSEVLRSKKLTFRLEKKYKQFRRKFVETRVALNGQVTGEELHQCRIEFCKQQGIELHD